MEIGVDTLSQSELDELFSDEQSGTQQSPAADGNSSNPQQNKGDIEETKAFSKRLKERTDKAIAEERQAIATRLGFASYDDMMKQQENKLLEDKGLDPEQVSPIVEELVQKRLNEDPRMKELENYKQRQVQEFAQKELEELSKLTGVSYTSIDQLPKDVIDDWRKSGSLKKSYISLHGEELILKAKAAASRGTTQHLEPVGSTPAPATDSGKRHLTDDEKRVWKFFNPQMTQEELDKKMIDK